MADNIGRELDWTEEIENDSPEYTTLPEGEYDFTVTKFERGRFEPKPTSKLPECNMAILTLQIDALEGSTSFQHRLYLHTSTEGLLCAFFSAIGQRQHGERIAMNWSAVLGARGRAKVGVRKYTNKNGNEVTVNEVKRFINLGETDAARTKPASYKPGQF